MGCFCEILPHFIAGLNVAMTDNFFIKETYDCLEHGSDGPGRVPFFSMILCDCQANFSVDLKSTILVEKHDIWRFEGILEGQEDLTMVDSFMEVSVLGSTESKMPSVKVSL